MKISPAYEYLNDRKIEYKIFDHHKPIKDLGRAAKDRGQDISQIVRSILLRISTGEYILVLTPGNENIPWKKLRKYLNISRITMAPKNEVEQITGFPPGAVTPFCLKRNIPIYININVFKNETISIGSGSPGIAIIMKSSDLTSAINDYSIIDFSNIK